MGGWGWMGGGTIRTEGLKFKVLGSLFEVGCFSGVMPFGSVDYFKLFILSPFVIDYYGLFRNYLLRVIYFEFCTRKPIIHFTLLIFHYRNVSSQLTGSSHYSLFIINSSLSKLFLLKEYNRQLSKFQNLW